MLVPQYLITDVFHMLALEKIKQKIKQTYIFKFCVMKKNHQY